MVVLYYTKITLFESENERQKIEPVPIPLPRASRNFPDVKTRNDFFFIIGLRRKSHLSVLGCRWTGPRIFFEMSKVAFFIVIQLCYNGLWPFSHEKWSKIENLGNLAFEKSQKILSKMPK